ncbi:phage structural protein [Peribacillus sp. B-H-3]|uniref:phage structural protein n=1 Tax=Peribacillus sp. B-H-3 TaxID=3400420 RepID=UPI003B02A8BB
MGNYDANLCTLTVDGTFITGFEDGTMISAEKDEDAFSTKVSALGEVIISETNNPLGTVTATLSQTSPSYAFLMAKAKSKKEFPIWVNYSGTPPEKAGGTRARVKKTPAKEFADEASSREFAFQIFDFTES